MKKKILIIEDEVEIARGIELNLTDEGYEVDIATDGMEGYNMALSEVPDLIILDIMLPGKNGFDICKDLRKNNIPTNIIMLTAKSDEVDKIVGLEIGADDYMAKPFSIRELVARVKAHLRKDDRNTLEIPKKLNIKNGHIDFAHFKVLKNNKEADLTSIEVEILKLLYSRNGEVVTRDELFDKIWGYESYPNTRTIDNHILKLRKKIEDNYNHPTHILSVYGEGYRFVE
ncbi:MAG: response regulator transcription factor [Melioribacteraceae bacterium]|nr:response regulator transcription factor [Melioribacteraceae bacterium]